MPTYLNELKQITEILLQPEDNYGELLQITRDLYQLFVTVAGFNDDAGPNREALHLSRGKAIGPTWAGMCIKEMMRTKRFLRGVYCGIQSTLAKFSERPLRILYAGTGPFATLALPLTTIFSSNEISFTLLEINPISIQYLEKVIRIFGAEEYVSEIIQCDAAKYRGDSGKPFQMMISETMQNALQKEPQVAITLNLVPLLAAGGIMIPENITVDARLVNPEKCNERMITGVETDYYYPLGNIFELNQKMAAEYSNAGVMPDHFLFPGVEIEIPHDIPDEYNDLGLFTTIQVFGDNRLTPWQCSLTMPQRIMEMDNGINQPARIRFQYRMNQYPGFVWQVSNKLSKVI